MRRFWPYLLLSSALVFAEESACPKGSESAVTLPAPVEPSAVLEGMASLKTLDGKLTIDLSADLVGAVHHIFDAAKVKTKMEQFYRLLHVIALHAAPSLGDELTLDAPAVRNLLLKAAVFSDPGIPSKIMSVAIDRDDRDEPEYAVTFSDEETSVPLNRGEGFYLFRNGKCQHAQKLIFRQTFSFQLSMNRKNNLLAKNFRGVDLFGDFGNRGAFDVDIQYVSLRAVEFYQGTNLGKVTVYVSREEFKKNKHNLLLRMITRIVPDRSVQPIDW